MQEIEAILYSEPSRNYISIESGAANLLKIKVIYIMDFKCAHYTKSSKSMQVTKGAILQIKENNQRRFLWKLGIVTNMTILVEMENFVPTLLDLLLEVLFGEWFNSYIRGT